MTVLALAKVVVIFATSVEMIVTDKHLIAWLETCHDMT